MESALSFAKSFRDFLDCFMVVSRLSSTSMFISLSLSSFVACRDSKKPASSLQAIGMYDVGAHV